LPLRYCLDCKFVWHLMHYYDHAESNNTLALAAEMLSRLYVCSAFDALLSSDGDRKQSCKILWERKERWPCRLDFKCYWSHGLHLGNPIPSSLYCGMDLESRVWLVSDRQVHSVNIASMTGPIVCRRMQGRLRTRLGMPGNQCHRPDSLTSDARKIRNV
jgi:hypothetical protein